MKNIGLPEPVGNEHLSQQEEPGDGAVSHRWRGRRRLSWVVSLGARNGSGSARSSCAPK